MSCTVKESMSTTFEDKGHRLGNFHNYYSFNPCQNRLDVLRDCGILRYLREKYTAPASSAIRTTCDRDGDGDGESRNVDEGRRKAKRAKVCNESNSSNDDDNRTFAYCDLGCNEGDLSLALSNDLLSGNDSSSSTLSAAPNPCSTMKKRRRPIRCLGLDIDPRLIDRANGKMRPVSDDGNERLARIEGVRTSTAGQPSIQKALFRVCNLCDADDHTSKCEAFLTEDEEDKNDDTNANTTTKTITEGGVATQRKRFDLTTIFSTTMWIHIHSGDDGLVAFLERTCRMTDLLVVEPQPSKCYRSVNVRLRKMNRPGVDASSERLTMRINIEEEVHRVIVGCGFKRVVMELELGRDKGGTNEEGTTEGFGANGNSKDKGSSAIKSRTAWNRSVQLYERHTG